jgi:putative heme iron utilization protein
MSMPLSAELSPERAAATRAELAARPDAMTRELARTHGVPKYTMRALLEPPRVIALDHLRWEALLRGLAALGDVRVLVSNGGVTLESHGMLGGFSRTGPYFNVQTSSIDLHVRWEQIAGILAVEKPSHQPGHPTASVNSFEPQCRRFSRSFCCSANGPRSRRPRARTSQRFGWHLPSHRRHRHARDR